MILVETTMTADNTDVLDGTDLDSIPRGGVLVVEAASTQNDTLMSLTGPNAEPVVQDQALILRANAEIRSDSDPSYPIPVTQGGHFTIAIDVVTAATVRVRATFYDLDEISE